ncbi:hypothetical protein ACFLRA_03695, partial [Bdellovibrionota bacterium]
MSTKALKAIKGTAEEMRQRIQKKKRVEMKFPIRSLQNVKYRPKIGFLELGDKFKSRTLSYNTVKAFAQSLRMMSVSKTLIETDDFAS